MTNMKQITATFTKNYTRDTSLIIQQLWFKAMKTGIQKLGIASPPKPVGIDHINEGAVEVWENEKTIAYLKKQFVGISISHPKKILKMLTWYQTGLEELKKIWKKEKLNTKKELLDFIEKVDNLMIGDLFICELFISFENCDKNIPARIQKISAKLRAEDHFFIANDSVIRNSLKKLFPKLKDFVTCIKIEELNGTPPAVDECKKRFHNFIITSEGYSSKQTLETYAQQNKNLIFKKDTINSKHSARGIIAYQGAVQGTARIVRLQKEIIKVKKNDIIISPMTTEGILPALLKAGGWVTDEGGLLCHAAIIAREMRKPCLTSVKIATKIFKDGDTVEIDAFKGVIKKI